MDIKIADFLGKLNGIDIATFGASVTQFRYRIALEGPVQEVTEWVLHPASPIIQNVEAFISLRIRSR